MRQPLFFVALVSLAIAGLISAFVPRGADAGAPGTLEEQVQANLVRVKIQGEWTEFPMMPLSDHLCRNPDRLFKRYCSDDVATPSSPW